MKLAAVLVVVLACDRSGGDVERATEARGGRSKLLGCGTIHVEGRVQFAGTPEPLALDAFVDVAAGQPRGRIRFTQGSAYRALLLSGGRGFERDESGAYHETTDSALAELRGEVATLLLASRFPLDGPWEAPGSARFVRPSDGVEVDVDEKALPLRVRVPGAQHDRRRLGDWREWSGIRFPSVIEALDGDGVAWRLDVTRWSPHAFAVDAFFRPPQREGELSLEDGPASAPAIRQPARLAQPFLRRDLAPATEVLSLPRPLAVGSEELRDRVAAAAASRQTVREIWGVLDDSFSIASLELVGPSPPESRPAPREASLWIAIGVVGSDRAAEIRDKARQLAEAARSASLEAEGSPRLRLRSDRGMRSETRSSSTSEHELVREVHPSSR